MIDRTIAEGALSVALARAPDAETGAAAPPAETAASPESILFPYEKPSAAEPEQKSGETKADWKEYEADPAKSAEENAAAKVEHDKTKPKAADPADVVPEDGKYDLKMPDGVELDQPLLDAVAPMLKAKGYTAREAQDLTDAFIRHRQAEIAKQQEGWAGTIQKWADDAKADKDMGGAKWDATLSDAKRTLNAFGTPELREYLQSSGAGNHPEIIRVFAKAGAMIKEDNPASGGTGGQGKPADPAHRLFPNDAPKGK